MQKRVKIGIGLAIAVACVALLVFVLLMVFKPGFAANNSRDTQLIAQSAEMEQLARELDGDFD